MLIQEDSLTIKAGRISTASSTAALLSLPSVFSIEIAENTDLSIIFSQMIGEDEKKKYQRLIDRGWGWKVYRKGPKGLHSQCFGTIFPKPINRWMQEKDYKTKTLLTNDRHRKYKKGFHVLLTREGARDWAWNSHAVVRKVKFKDIRAHGWQEEFPCIVVGQVLITKERG